MPLPEVVLAKTDDLPALAALAKTTFVESFGWYNTAEDMKKYLAEEMSEAKLRTEFSDPASLFLLAKVNDVLIGYAKMRLGPHPDAPPNCKPLEIERIYVLAAHQKQKAGAALMNYCVSYARTNQYDTVWLGVWEHNQKAIDFYLRWGFEVFGTHPFLLGSDLQTDVLMKLSLV